MTTKIEWTDETWNPVVGCTKVSEGCQNCYAEKMAYRLACMGQRKYQKVVQFTNAGIGEPANPKWTGDIYCDEKALDIPLHWRSPRQIFVCSMGDLFHPAVPFSFIDKVVEVAKKCPQHTLQFLTKRASIMYDYSKYRDFKWPENIIGMVTAENQVRADWCIPYLLRCGFKTTGVSLEPLLELVDLSRIDFSAWETTCIVNTLSGEIVEDSEIEMVGTKDESLDWVIIGCESGPGRRPCKLEWVRSIVQQCKAAGVRVFVKQLSINGKASHDPAEWPEDLRIR